ncbi:MAG TPA: CpaD family pilus assembly protein [Rhizomicrobium sp.]|nr:CpaD family pilus assembly protein [Rhizomicrobium sp.]
MKLDYLLRAAALASILAAGSCSVTNDGSMISEDGVANHPIAVEPSYRELKVYFAGGAEGVSADDAVKFDEFLADYRAHGNGSLGISVPGGAPSRAAITFFAERAAATGISRDKILVSTHDVANGDLRVDVSYIAYNASTQACGDWSENLAFSGDNLTPKNFGCSIQHNIAAMVADPRDLLQPRRFDPADANRAGTVITNYELGKPTPAEKTNDQSGAVSDINKQ